MKQADIIKIMAGKLGVKKSFMAVLFDDFFLAFRDILKDGNSIIINNFGKFEVTVSNPKDGRDPRTGEYVFVPAKNKLRFKVSRNLKNYLQDEED